MYSSTQFLTSALDGREWSASRHSRFIPKEIAPDTHWIGGWVGPRAALDAVVKRKITKPCRDSNPRTIQPVAQRYNTELSRLSAKLNVNVCAPQSLVLNKIAPTSHSNLIQICDAVCEMKFGYRVGSNHFCFVTMRL
jgi:hypothetical protein